MITNNERNFFLDFNIDNTRVMITNSGGFFKDRFTHNEGAIHSHSSYELHVVFDGTAVLEAKTGQYSLAENEGCIVPPNLLHYPINGLPQCTRMSFCFAYEHTGEKTKDDLYSHFTSALGTLTDVTGVKNAKRLADLLKEALVEFYSNGKFQEHRLIGYFTLVITELIESLEDEGESEEINNSQSDGKPGDARALTRTIMEEYVNLRFAQNPTLSELAQLIHFSNKQTARLFEKSFGTSFKQYILKLRTDSAKYFLINTAMSVEEIAANVGYSSYNGFYRIFLSQVGKSPLEFRKQERVKK